MERLVAIGYDRAGERILIESTDDAYGITISCIIADLVSLEIPDGINIVHCDHNYLTSLQIPNSVKQLFCSNNKITSLEVPDTIMALHCQHNKIKKLSVPNQMTSLKCDKEVKGLNKLLSFSANYIEVVLY